MGAAVSDLPEGFVLDEDPASLPEGFVLDAPEAKKPKAFGPWASAAIRPIAQGIAGLPLLAMDAGVGTRNLIEGRNKKGQYPYELPSATFNQFLDSKTEKPEGLGRVGEFVSSALVGSRLPAPQAANQAPAGFRGQVSPRDVTLQTAQKQGYVVPPSTTNPSMLNRVLESIGGKDGTAQDAALRNMEVTNTLARRAVGLTDDTAITPEALSAVRAGASAPYNAVRAAGEIASDSKLADDLAAITEKYRGAAKDFPGLARTDILDIVESVNQPKFSADSGLDAISILRDKADAAFRGGDKGLGKAYREVSKAIEDVIERNLSGRGEAGAELLKQFREARQLIAKTYSVEKALNASTGNVNAAKLGSQLARGAPLSGDLATAGRFGQAFPRAAREMLDSGSVRNTDVILGGGASVLSQEPGYLLYPYLRQLARSGLLSEAGQTLATPSQAQIPGGLLMGPVPQINLLSQ